MDDGREIGARLKWVREHLGMSGVEFGTKIGLSQSKIADLERGKTKISIEVMNLLEREYGISRDWLIDGFGDWKKSAAIETVIKKIEEFEAELTQLPLTTKILHAQGLISEDDFIEDTARVHTVLQATEKFKTNLGLLKLATKKANALGLPREDATRVQEIIFGVEAGDRNTVERALNNLAADEFLLLKNYRACSSQGKKALKCTSEALTETLTSSINNKK